MLRIRFLLFSVISFSLLSCTSVPDAALSVAPENTDELSLLFAGDIMAHKPNYSFGKFDAIWEDVKEDVSAADLAFANIEAPVAESLEWSTYPAFNMHHSYIESVIAAGFDVFSLANNHTNDQLLQGIKETREYFASLKGQNIYAAGLKFSSGGPLTYQLIEKNGWKVLFVAVTQLLNRNDASSWIDYYPSTEKKLAQLKADIKKLNETVEHDLFIVSIHCDEAEYVRTVSDTHRTLYRELAEKYGVDIVWANHPHVVKEWEVTAGGALIMYANGNTISAQRTNPQFLKPETERDYTGDGLFMKVKVAKLNGKNTVTALKPVLVTTYKTPLGQYVVRKLDDDLIHSLRRAGVDKWPEYLAARKKIMAKIKGPVIWQ